MKKAHPHGWTFPRERGNQNENHILLHACHPSTGRFINKLAYFTHHAAKPF
jgi:hypothetical protein